MYDCAIWCSLVLMGVFGYDGFIMGFVELSFWRWVVLPHVLVAVGVVCVIWRKGVFQSFPVAYILGFAAFLAITMVNQQTFLRNQIEFKGNVSFKTVHD